MTVTAEKGYTRDGGIQGSGPVAAAGGVPVELGAGIHGQAKKDNVGSYGTAPSIVFAYRLNVIRQKMDGDVESEMFSSRTGFMTGGVSGAQQVEMELAEVLPQDLEIDIEDDDLRFTEHKVGDQDVCVSFA